MENWMCIPGYDGYYMVSDHGNVKSVERLVDHSNGGKSVMKGRTLRLESMKGGYKRATLSIKNKQKRFQVHRLVAMAFIPNPENKPCVNHIDGNTSNNNVSNLEWVTHSENERHSYNKLGKVNHNRKLSDKDIRFIKRNFRKGRSGNVKMLSICFDVSISTIYNVINNRYYV